MAISIPQIANIKPVMHNRVEGKDNPSSRYSDNNRHSAADEKKSQDNQDNNARDGFNMGLDWLMKADLAEEVKNKNTPLTGIIEMNAIGLQFFLAMQRQIVYFRLAEISERDYTPETNN